jgi:hypothetical protein
VVVTPSLAATLCSWAVVSSWPPRGQGAGRVAAVDEPLAPWAAPATPRPAVPSRAIVEVTAAILREGDVGCSSVRFVWMHEEHRRRT